MPNIIPTIKDYCIKSENDIPPEYKEKVFERINNIKTTKEEQDKITPIINSGEQGELITDKTKIEEIFQDNKNLYFGHGTTGEEETINSILQTGLKVKNPESVAGYDSHLRGLDSTTITLGTGTNSLFNEQENLLNNWPHKQSKNIIIASLPLKYALNKTEVGTNFDIYTPFYTGNNETGYNLRPEFIKGIYNSESKSFTPNNNFYQNLDSEKQEQLFNSIREEYIEQLSKKSLVRPESIESELPLNKKEKDELTIRWYTDQITKLKQDKTFDEKPLKEGLLAITSELTTHDLENRLETLSNEITAPTNNKEGWEL